MGRRSVARGRLAAASILVALTVGGGAARAELEGIPTPFGTANDPVRPLPEEPVVTGPGVVALSVVRIGAATIAELGAEAGALTAVELAAEVAPASTTALVTAATARAGLASGDSIAALGACLLARDDEIELIRADGLRFREWTVSADGAAYRCSGGAERLAFQLADGGFRLRNWGQVPILEGGGQAPAAPSEARLLLVFPVSRSDVRSVRLLGVETSIEPAALAPTSDAPARVEPD